MIELDTTDRRRSVRLDFVSEVMVRSSNGEKIIKGELVNLGIGGMSLKTPVLLDNGTNCVVEILIKDRYSHLSINGVEGKVVRSNEDEIAVQFAHRFEWLALFYVYLRKSSEEV